MAIFAVAFPVAPGQTENWRAWMEEVAGPRRDEFVASRRAVGVRERTFLHATPMGDIAIIVLEGDDPEASFDRLMNTDDEFSRWFGAKAAEVHGVDTSQPMPAITSTLVLDSEG